MLVNILPIKLTVFLNRAFLRKTLASKQLKQLHFIVLFHGAISFHVDFHTHTQWKQFFFFYLQIKHFKIVSIEQAVIEKENQPSHKTVLDKKNL